MEIKIYKESDMESNSLSKLHSQQLGSLKMSHSSRIERKATRANHSKWRNICKVLNEEVCSFQRLVLLTAVIAFMCVTVGGMTLGDHIILATLSWGRYEW
jgi:hypothetical protein